MNFTQIALVALSLYMSGFAQAEVSRKNSISDLGTTSDSTLKSILDATKDKGERESIEMGFECEKAFKTRVQRSNCLAETYIQDAVRKIETRRDFDFKQKVRFNLCVNQMGLRNISGDFEFLDLIVAIGDCASKADVQLEME